MADTPDSSTEAFEQVDYTLPVEFPNVKYVVDPISVVVRRRKPGQKPSLRGVFSHQHCGVDNTGNVRVWAAEEVLVHMLCCEEQRELCKGKNICELGAGMSGLAGLCVGAVSSSRSNSSSRQRQWR